MAKSLVVLFLTLTAVSLSFGQRVPQPPKSYVDRGACPFECCHYGPWTVEKPTAIRAGMSDRSTVIYRLKSGEKVRGITGVVVTTKPGILEVIKDTKLEERPLKRGEKLYILTYLGEGFSKIWHNGRIFQGDPVDDAAYKSLREGRAVWWVKIKDRRGRTGWTRLPENFGNKDRC